MSDRIKTESGFVLQTEDGRALLIEGGSPAPPVWDPTTETWLELRADRVLQCQTCGQHYNVRSIEVEYPYQCLDCDALGRTGTSLRDAIILQGSMIWLGDT